MSATVDNIIYMLNRAYWSAQADGRAVFPLRSGPNGFKPPGEYLEISEGKNPDDVEFAIKRKTRSVVEEPTERGIRAGVSWSRHILSKYGVPRE